MSRRTRPASKADSPQTTRIFKTMTGQDCPDVLINKH